MQDTLYNLALGYVFGLLLAVPPGPMNALIAAESTKSHMHGTAVGLGAMTADAVLMIITYELHNALNQAIIHAMYIVGFTVMTYLAYTIIRSTFKPRQSTQNTNLIINYFMGLTMGITNPYQIIWWLTAGLSFMSIFGPLSIAGLFLAIITWVTTFPRAVKAGVTYGGGRAAMIIKALSAAGIMAFAAYILITAIKYLTL
ncbi:LysE family translocator [Vulcanisaeta thermophila]|uniref:LysE family translocator n=1 Tax=Vulcanisaeta thermophila TaxID=867917 RepID=UPI000852E90B|nr:LysE family transporter [Vulcanisaeta thermophila]